jgi:DNA mismatch endonuclease (patch repair protein)
MILLSALPMVDNLSKKVRSKVMASIKGKNTKPEVTVRRLLWAAGKRYRVHDRTVFGIPDISNKNKKVAIFIDGCFWHGCSRCYKEPTTNIAYWRNKIRTNIARRKAVTQGLQKNRWTVLQFWEHEIKEDPEGTTKSITQVL